MYFHGLAAPRWVAGGVPRAAPWPGPSLRGVANPPSENTEGDLEKLPAAGAVAGGRCGGGILVGVGQVCHSIVLGALRCAARVHGGGRGARARFSEGCIY